MSDNRSVPSSSTLRACKHIGWALIIIGTCMFLYWAGFKLVHIDDWPIDYDQATGAAIYPQPYIEWWPGVILFIPGVVIACISSSRYKYWYVEVLSGTIVQKDIKHYSEYSVSYMVYIKGETRAGTINTYGWSVAHGDYEEFRKGQPLSFAG